MYENIPPGSKVLQNATVGAFCNTFDRHLEIISLFEGVYFTQDLL